VLSIVAKGNDLKACGEALIKGANENGGTDNITVILGEVSGGGLPQPNPDQPAQVEELAVR
ncbi:MAG: hypothetical protein ACRD23_14405, partial [Terriglobales bacterium]